MKNFLEKNRHGIFSAKVGVGSSVLASAPVVISYCLKPEEFLQFVTQHVAATAVVGVVTLLIIAALMYVAYRHSQQKWDSEMHQYVSETDPHTKIDEDPDEPYILVDSSDGPNVALSPTGSLGSLNTQSFR